MLARSRIRLSAAVGLFLLLILASVTLHGAGAGPVFVNLTACSLRQTAVLP
jgi:hypothetical protein